MVQRIEGIILLELIDLYNHLIKQGDWYEEDVKKFYLLKDQVLEYIYVSMGGNKINLDLVKVPFVKRCKACKDKAGNMMRADPTPKGFEYYLEQVPICTYDHEDSEKATVEMQIELYEKHFCFHIPLHKAKAWDIDIDDLNLKKWIPSKEFNRMRLDNDLNKMKTFFNNLK